LIFYNIKHSFLTTHWSFLNSTICFYHMFKFLLIISFVVQYAHTTICVKLCINQIMTWLTTLQSSKIYYHRRTTIHLMDKYCIIKYKTMVSLLHILQHCMRLQTSCIDWEHKQISLLTAQLSLLGYVVAYRIEMGLEDFDGIWSEYATSAAGPFLIFC
jgi:hypothetical protein